MKWRIEEIKSVREFFQEAYGNPDNSDELFDCDQVMSLMKNYAEHLLDGVATQASVNIKHHIKPDKSRSYAHYADENLWAKACPKSIRKHKNKL